MAKPRYDWKGIAAMLEENATQWICPLPNVPRSTAATARRRDIPALRDLRQRGTIESVSVNSYVDNDGKEWSDVWLRWTPAGRRLSPERPKSNRKHGDPRRIHAEQRAVQVPAGLADRVRQVTEAAGVSVTAYMTEMVNTLIDEGTDYETDGRGMQSLNFRMPTERWEQARQLAARKGVPLRAILLHELYKRFGQGPSSTEEK